MEYSFVLLLMSIVRVQGYYNNSNGTTSNYHYANQNKYIYHNQEFADRSRNKHFNEKQFDQVFQYYRSERREPRFISFQTKDDNIEVEIDFAIPFLSIPVRRSLSGAMGTLQNVINVSHVYHSSSSYTFVFSSSRESRWQT